MPLTGDNRAVRPPAPLRISNPPLDDDAVGALLSRVLGAAARVGGSGVVVFDLDSTLLDNRPRQAQIMREYGRAAQLAELAACETGHWRSWDERVAMANAGLPDAAIDEHAAPFKRFWFDRFFTSEYCALDAPIAGAPGYVRAVAARGARVRYVTGRHEAMRHGTARSLRRADFPEADGDRVALWMKPDLDEDDGAYKRRIHGRLDALGQVVAAFDNEPRHINDYRERFADAICVHLATDHSPDAVRVEAGIPSIPDFRSHLSADGALVGYSRGE